MSQHNSQTDVLLIPGESSWIAWCPSVDICTQGDSPENAVGMAIDALGLVFSDDLFAFDREDVLRVRKRVSHPLRRGMEDHVRTDEHWAVYDDYLNGRGAWRRQTSVRVPDLIPSMGPAVVLGNVFVEVRGGILNAHPSMNDWAQVPARNFDFRIQVVHEYSRVVAVPAALLADDAPLRRSGLSVESIARSFIADRVGETVLDWSLKESPSRDIDDEAA